MDIRQIQLQCIEQENTLQFSSFSQTQALELGTRLYETSRRFPSPAAIEIRINHLPVFSFYPDGTNANNTLWLRAKANTVDMLQQSSLRYWADVQLTGKTPDERRMPEKEFACCGGGFPLTVKNIGVIGTICVSGLPHTQDHQVIIDTLREYLKES